jgi:SAM-dependent methyltransferase
MSTAGTATREEALGRWAESSGPTAGLGEASAAVLGEIRRNSDLASLDFDQLYRYGAAAVLLRPLVARAGRRVRILEVGANALHLLPAFFHPLPVDVVRCETVGSGIRFDHSDFVLIDEHQPLPFRDHAFDFTVALEVLEHIPPSQRAFAVGEWARVASKAVLLSTPNGCPAVAQAEGRARAAYHQRRDHPHPWLEEHEEFGICSEAEVTTLLDQLELQYAVLGNSPVSEWLPLLLLTEELAESNEPEITRLFNRCFNLRSLSFFTDRLPYRNIYVCARHGEDLGFTRGAVASRYEANAAGIGFQGLVDPLWELAHSLAQVFQQQARELLAERARIHSLEALLSRRVFDQRLQCRTWRNRVREAMVRLTIGRHRRLELAELLGDTVRHQIAALGAPDGHRWESLGSDPYFVLPLSLPAGPVRIEIAGQFPRGGVTKLYYDDGAGFSEARHVQLPAWNGEKCHRIEWNLPCPIAGLRLDPIENCGHFVLHTVSVQRISEARRRLMRIGERVFKKLVTRDSPPDDQ